MLCFESVFLSEVCDSAIFFLNINVVQLRTHIHTDGSNVLGAEFFLLFFLLFCQFSNFLLSGKLIDSVYLFLVHVSSPLWQRSVYLLH